MDWDHHRTAKSDDVQVIAAIFPQDGFIASFRERTEAE